MASFVNHAFYQFAKIPSPEAVKEELLRQSARAPSVRGTVLVTPEGINTYYAGSNEDTKVLLESIRAIPGFEAVEPKISLSEEQPFRRLVIKNKREAISLGIPDLDPNEITGAYLKPAEFKRWMDENPDDFVLVDTRNDYEVEIGTFEGAINPNIKTFKEFPKWLEENLSDQKHKKIVTFCTGGIRCEKATAHMIKAGYENVYQIDGGILKYLEETQDMADSNHWNGDCFVFDYRVAVGKDLKPTDKAVCFACWSVLAPEEMQSPQYVEGKSCPKCYDRQQAKIQKQKEISAQKRAALLEKRRAYGAQMKALHSHSHPN